MFCLAEIRAALPAAAPAPAPALVAPRRIDFPENESDIDVDAHAAFSSHRAQRLAIDEHMDPFRPSISASEKGLDVYELKGRFSF